MIVGIANRLISGSYLFTVPHVNKGCSVSIERYTMPDGTDGFMFIVNTPEHKLTNYCLYDSVESALNASDEVKV